MFNWTAQKIEEVLSKNEIFSIFNQITLKKIVKGSAVKELPSDALLIEQGNIVEKELFFLLEGELEVFKEIAGKSYLLGSIHAGTLVGENVIMGENERAASVKAKTKAVILAIPLEIFDQGVSAEEKSDLYKKVHSQTLSYLKAMNLNMVELLKKQKNFAIFFIDIVIFLSLFSISLPILHRYVAHETEPIWTTSGIIAFATLLLVIRLIVTKTPLSTIGFVTKNLTRSMIESVLFSALVIGAIIAIKVLMIRWIPGFHQHHLFSTFKELITTKQGFAPSDLFLFFLGCVYAIHSFFQELLVRGALQGTFKNLLPLKKTRKVFAVSLSSLIFAAAHSYYGVGAVLAVFIPGLFWGWMYERHGTIFSVWLSHALIGLIFFGFIHR